MSLVLVVGLLRFVIITICICGVDFPCFFQDVVPKYPANCDVEWVDSEDPLFLLYTSGSTGKPKVSRIGIVYFFQFSFSYPVNHIHIMDLFFSGCPPHNWRVHGIHCNNI